MGLISVVLLSGALRSSILLWPFESKGLIFKELLEKPTDLSDPNSVLLDPNLVRSISNSPGFVTVVLAFSLPVIVLLLYSTGIGGDDSDGPLRNAWKKLETVFLCLALGFRQGLCDWWCCLTKRFFSPAVHLEVSVAEPPGVSE